MMGLPEGGKSFKVDLVVCFDTISAVTDRQTYRQTDTQPARHDATARTALCYRVAQVTRSSADADKPPRRVYRSVKVTKHSTIPYIMYSLLLCNSNFVFKIFTIFDFQKCHDFEIGVTRGH